MIAVFTLIGLQLTGQGDEIIYSEIDTNHHAATYLGITTTPYTLPKGAMNYQNLYVGYNGFEYGLSDRFTISGGFSLFNFTDDGGGAFFTLAKYNFLRTENTAVSLSNLNIVYPGYQGLGAVSILYTNAAFGNKNNFVTLGAGFGYSFEESDIPVGIFTFGYHNRFSKSMAFMVDVWLAVLDLDSNGVGIPLPSIAFRFFLKNDITIDLGLPLFGFKIPINRVDKSNKIRGI